MKLFPIPGMSLRSQAKRYSKAVAALEALEIEAHVAHEAIQDEIVSLAARGQQHYNIVMAAKARLA